MNVNLVLMRLEGSYYVARNQDPKMESFMSRYHDNKMESLSRYQDNKVESTTRYQENKMESISRYQEKSPLCSADVFPLSPTSPYEVHATQKFLQCDLFDQLMLLIR